MVGRSYRQALRRRISATRWMIRLRSGPQPITVGEWVATVDPRADALHASQDYVVLAAMQVTAIGPKAADVTLHHIDEETG